MQSDDRSEQEKPHAKHVQDFFYHLMTYVFVCVLLVIVDRRGGVGDQAILGLDWAYWVILFWGVGVAGHAISVFLGDRRDRNVDERARPQDPAAR